MCWLMSSNFRFSETKLEKKWARRKPNWFKDEDGVIEKEKKIPYFYQMNSPMWSKFIVWIWIALFTWLDQWFYWAFFDTICWVAETFSFIYSPNFHFKNFSRQYFSTNSISLFFFFFLWFEPKLCWMLIFTLKVWIVWDKASMFLSQFEDVFSLFLFR